MATLFGTTGTIWGCSAETAVLIQSIEVSDATDEQAIANNEGEECAVSMFNRKQEVTAEWYVAGAGGLNTITPGASTVLNNVSGFTGLVVIKEKTIKKENKDYEKHTLKAVIRPLIV